MSNTEQTFTASAWWYTSAGQKQGPIPFHELAELVNSGKVLASDKAWTKGQADWALVAAVPELQPYLAIPPDLPEETGPPPLKEATTVPVKDAPVGLRLAAGFLDLAAAIWASSLLFMFAVFLWAVAWNAWTGSDFSFDLPYQAAIGLAIWWWLAMSTLATEPVGKRALGLQLASLDGTPVTDQKLIDARNTAKFRQALGWGVIGVAPITALAPLAQVLDRRPTRYDAGKYRVVKSKPFSIGWSLFSLMVVGSLIFYLFGKAWDLWSGLSAIAWSGFRYGFF